jgi:protein O-mannosyl-transferase
MLPQLICVTPRNKARRVRTRPVEPAAPAAQSKWRLSPRISIAIAVVALSALVLIAYSNSLGNGFVWDDSQQIVMNPELRAGSSWGHLFSSDVWGYKHRDQPARGNYYRPLQMAAYRLTAEWFGLEARHLHILSLAFALGAALSAFLVYRRLTRRLAPAFAAAALFAVHPMHSEAVDWISALPELGCALFFLIAFGLFLLTRTPELGAGTKSGFLKKRWSLFGLSLLAFAIALLWKETAAVFPIVVGAYAYCFACGSFRERFRLSARVSFPFWCVLSGYLALRFRMLGYLTTSQRIWGLSDIQVALSDFYLMALYWWKLAVPIHLNAYHVFSPVGSILDVRALSGILFLLAAAVAIRYGLGRAPLATFAALWVFIGLLPVMNIFALGRNVFAERYLYLPSVGFSLLVVAVASSAIKHLPERSRPAVSAVLLFATVAGFSWETLVRNPDWHDQATLFHQTLSVSPDAPFVHFMVAAAESENPRELRSAESHYLRAIDLAENENPPDLLDLTQSEEGLASLYADRGDFPQALRLLDQWRKVSPNDPELDAEQGLVLLKSGQWQAAEPVLNRAFAARPQDENVLNALGLLAWQYKRNLNQAREFFSEALRVHTSQDDFQASLYNNLGGVYGDLEQFPLAVEQFQSASAISPENAEYHTNLAVALAEEKRYPEAAAEAQTALRISPDYSPARAVLEQLQQH